MRRAARTIFAVGAIGLALLLAVGWFGAVHPAFDSVAHFRIHIAFVAVIVLVMAIALKLRTLAATLLLTIVVSLALTYPSLPGLAPDGGRASFTVAQQNLLYLNVLPEQAARTLGASGADILLLQEVSERNAAIVDGLATAYPHRTICRFRKFRGVAILSKAPFATEPACLDRGGLTSVGIVIGGRTVTFASLHTYWPWPYPQWTTIRSIETELRALPQPLVLAGDFNAAPWSALVGKIARDTRTQVVPGLRFTFNLRPLQGGDHRFGGLPLDHVLHSDGLQPTGIELLPHVGSDHLGSLAGFTFSSAAISR